MRFGPLSLTWELKPRKIRGVELLGEDTRGRVRFSKSSIGLDPEPKSFRASFRESGSRLG